MIRTPAWHGLLGNRQFWPVIRHSPENADEIAQAAPRTGFAYGLRPTTSPYACAAKAPGWRIQSIAAFRQASNSSWVARPRSIDGSAIGANLGVNPSLTIAAMAERAMAMWPNNGDTDPRPGEPGYEHVAPVRPRDPAVPTEVLGVDVWATE